MQFFLDTAQIEEIKQAATFSIIDGVTTNPSLIAQTGRSIQKVIAEICDLIDGDISAEVIATDRKNMIEEATELASIHPNVVIKLPLTPDGISVCSYLSDKNIKTNLTLCFSPMQALLAAKAGASYVSPFIGRLDDISHDGMALIGEIRQIFDNYRYKTKILTASVRHNAHIREAALIGSDAITMPLKVLKSLYKHPLTDSGLKAFLESSLE